MDPTPSLPPPSDNRLLELDYALSQAVDRRDGEMARQIAERQSRELRGAAERRADDGGVWLREAADRLREQVARARAARTALGLDISGFDVQRKLVGAPVAGAALRFGRSFRA